VVISHVANSGAVPPKIATYRVEERRDAIDRRRTRRAHRRLLAAKKK
jgi:hypothetical protein